MNSLHTSDVFQLIFICALIFTPLGFYIARFFIKKKFVIRYIAKLQTKLTDKGAFTDYLNGGQK